MSHNQSDEVTGQSAESAFDASASTTNSPQSDKEVLGRLHEELKEAKAKAEEHWNLYLNAMAEAENVRKRTERDRINAQKYALERFINDLLPVKDSLEMGLAAAADANDVTKFKEGTELTLRMFNGVLEKASVQELNPQGERFDPEFHEAMAMEAALDQPPNTVLRVVQKGYVLNERLIRPALVVVSKP